MLLIYFPYNFFAPSVRMVSIVECMVAVVLKAELWIAVFIIYKFYYSFGNKIILWVLRDNCHNLSGKTYFHHSNIWFIKIKVIL